MLGTGHEEIVGSALFKPNQNSHGDRGKAGCVAPSLVNIGCLVFVLVYSSDQIKRHTPCHFFESLTNELYDPQEYVFGVRCHAVIDWSHHEPLDVNTEAFPFVQRESVQAIIW